MKRALLVTALIVSGCASKNPVSSAPAPSPAPAASRAPDEWSADEAEAKRAYREIRDYIVSHGTCRGDGGRLAADTDRRREVRDLEIRDGAPPGGKLPPWIIQHIVRQSYQEFRECYENGLRHDPKLTGRVTVRFVIGRDGHVVTVKEESSTIFDAEVTRCVVEHYYELCFPPPENDGIVTVVYPIKFSPGD